MSEFLISVSTCKFIGLEWLDANGHKTKIIGKRQEVFAKATLEGCGKIPISAHLYCWGTNGVESLSASPIPVKPDKNGIARISLSLTDSQAKKLQDFKLEHGTNANIWLSQTSGEWIENLRENLLFF